MAEKQYLDRQGLQALVSELKLKVVSKNEYEKITYSIKADESSSDYAAVYRLYEKINDNEPVAVSGSVINIPKDFLVKSATLETCIVDDVPVAGYKVGDKYIDFVVNTKDGSGNEEHIYINVQDLVDIYTAGNGIEINNNAISVKTNSLGAILNDANGIKVNVDNANGLELSNNSIKMKLATTTSNGAITNNEKKKLNALESINGVNYDSSNNEFTVKVVEENGLSLETNGITLNTVSTTNAGAMSAEDKTKLNSLEETEGIPGEDIEDLFN